MIWSFTPQQRKRLEALDYSQRKRVMWIGEQAYVFKGVGYAHLNLKFGVGRSPASKDFNLAAEIFGLFYEPMIKRWIPKTNMINPIKPATQVVGSNEKEPDHD